MPERKSITQAHLQRLLLVGLGVSAILLLSALSVAFRTVHQIDRNTRIFAEQQSKAKSAIDEIEKQQAELNNRWLELARMKDVVRREEILAQIAQNRAQMSSALESAYAEAELLRESIYQAGHGLLRWTVWLFASCVGLSLLCAIWAVRTSTGLFRRLEQQASELSSLQYQFLETQEQVARRFSHELHDELGQALTAVKANLSALRAGADSARIDDCMRLVDRAIENVREMSQLLRPTILDDFGLDAALRSLAESFSQRTGIEVTYRSNMNGRRLADNAETNLFRIAQEALTNVARHSGATVASVDLTSRNREVVMQIRDNGHGFQDTQGDGTQRGPRGLGLAGMRTRARGCGGMLKIDSAAGKGLTIEVTCPVNP